MFNLEDVDRTLVGGTCEILVLQVECKVAYCRGCASSSKLAEFAACRWIINSDQGSLRFQEEQNQSKLSFY